MGPVLMRVVHSCDNLHSLVTRLMVPKGYVPSISGLQEDSPDLDAKSTENSLRSASS
jgi:hypothetical protein